MMTNLELAEKCKHIATNVKTTYVWGGIGSPITEQSIADKVAQYNLNRTSGFEAKAKALIGKNAFMFDCVNLVKSVLWGWDGDSTKYNGGAIYGSNGVPDVNADAMIKKCENVSSDFSKIEIGEALWTNGHFGLYLGNGLGVEATPAWRGDVQITAVGNIGDKTGYPTRMWKKHGKLPYVEYVNSEEDDEMRYEKLSDIKSADYKNTVKKLMSKGILKGKSGTGENTVIDLSEDSVRLLVILDRSGIFDK